MRRTFTFLISIFAAALCIFPISTSAHEVYVLNQDQIHFDLSAPQPDFIAAITNHLGQFIFWGLLVIAIISIIFFISISRPLEKVLDPILLRIKPFAPHIAQATLGLALFASGWYGAVFGTELPLNIAFGPFAITMSWALMISGAMLGLGILPRLAGMFAVSVFVALSFKYGIYMLNYGTYLGEAVVIALFGGAHTLYASRKGNAFMTKVIPASAHAYSFLIMRVLFGVSLIYASLYAKFFHGALALDVVARYHLTQFFPFDPVFLVLGAMLIEILLGICFLIGFEIRFASLFFLIFLCLSVSFFGESVWPHIVLAGTALAMFVHGYDRQTFSVKLEKNKDLEPIL